MKTHSFVASDWTIKFWNIIFGVADWMITCRNIWNCLLSTVITTNIELSCKTPGDDGTVCIRNLKNKIRYELCCVITFNMLSSISDLFANEFQNNDLFMRILLLLFWNMQIRWSNFFALAKWVCFENVLTTGS